MFNLHVIFFHGCTEKHTLLIPNSHTVKNIQSGEQEEIEYFKLKVVFIFHLIFQNSIIFQIKLMISCS